MSKWCDVVTLIKTIPNETETNSGGFPIATAEQSRTVFCNKKSISYAEFYKASQSGYKVELKIELHTPDYCKEVYAEVDGKRYKVLKTYESKCGEFIELTLSNLSESGAVDG